MSQLISTFRLLRRCRRDTCRRLCFWNRSEHWACSTFGTRPVVTVLAATAIPSKITGVAVEVGKRE
jgi:hypothetical protein